MNKDNKEIVLPEAQCISIPKAAAMLGVGRSTLYAAIVRGEIYAVKLGRRRLIPIHLIRELIGDPKK